MQLSGATTRCSRFVASWPKRKLQHAISTPLNLFVPPLQALDTVERVDFSQTDIYGNNDLHWVAMGKTADQVVRGKANETLLSGSGVDHIVELCQSRGVTNANSKNKNGYRPLHYAARTGNVALVRQLAYGSYLWREQVNNFRKFIAEKILKSVFFSPCSLLPNETIFCSRVLNTVVDSVNLVCEALAVFVGSRSRSVLFPDLHSNTYVRYTTSEMPAKNERNCRVFGELLWKGLHKIDKANQMGSDSEQFC